MGMTQSVFCVCYMANVDGSYSTVFQLSGWERLFVNGKNLWLYNEICHLTVPKDCSCSNFKVCFETHLNV